MPYHLATSTREVAAARPGPGKGVCGAAAKAETGRPSIIVLHTIIGWPAPNKQNTGAAHGSALGDDELRATKEILGFDPDKNFDVAPAGIEHARQVVARGQKQHAAWQERFDAWKQS